MRAILAAGASPSTPSLGFLTKAHLSPQLSNFRLAVSVPICEVSMSGKNDSYPTRRVSSEPIQWPEDNWNGGGEWHLEYPYTLGMPCPFSDRSGGNAPQDRKVETARKAVLKGRRILRPHLKDRSYNMTQNSAVVTDTQHATDAPGNGVTAFVPTQGVKD